MHIKPFNNLESSHIFVTFEPGTLFLQVTPEGVTVNVIKFHFIYLFSATWKVKRNTHTHRLIQSTVYYSNVCKYDWNQELRIASGLAGTQASESSSAVSQNALAGSWVRRRTWTSVPIWDASVPRGCLICHNTCPQGFIHVAKLWNCS